MAIKHARTAYIALPSRSLTSRAGIVLLAVCGASLMMMSKAGSPAAARLREGIADIAAPALAVAASPMDALYNAGAWVKDWAGLHEENASLRAQNAQLLKWQAAAKAMQTENASLRTLLNVVPSAGSSYITARIVSDNGGPYVHSALINGGSENGIKKDEAVIDGSGLIGRVVETGQGSARVLLLSDINSRVPVMAEHAHEKAILTGNNTGMPTLSYLSSDSKIAIGDRIVTSGDGGVFPQGIPVGVVTAVGNGAVSVQPFADAAHAEYISVIDYAL